MYCPDGPLSSSFEDERREMRIEYRGGIGDDDMDDGMNGRRSQSMRRSMTPMNTGGDNELIDIIGNDCPRSLHSPIDDPIDDGGADIMYSAPASPEKYAHSLSSPLYSTHQMRDFNDLPK